VRLVYPHNFLQGREYDSIGNMRNWWGNVTLEEFKTRTACMEQQYSGYNLADPNMNVSGAHTLGENIADNGGLKMAYLAYEKFVNSEAEDDDDQQRLPGVPLSQKQLFFLSFSQVRVGCE
jgi:predicted metalloendopeptidase